MTNGEQEAFGRLLIARSSDDVDVQAAIAGIDFEQIQPPTDEDLFPRVPREGKCRICGEWAQLTREHIPPRSTQPIDRARAPTFEDWFRHDELDLPDAGPVIQGGVSGFILCERCNNWTGTNYGLEYQIWARGAAAVLTSLGVSLEELDSRDKYTFVNLRLVDVYPGRFVRQVLAMMLSVSGSCDLSERHSTIRNLVLGGPPESLPEQLRLFMTLYAGPAVRFAGGPFGQAIYDGVTGIWTRCIEVAFPPFAFQLILDGDAERASGVEMSELSACDADRTQTCQIEGLLVGFGHTPYPLDYRPMGMYES